MAGGAAPRIGIFLHIAHPYTDMRHWRGIGIGIGIVTSSDFDIGFGIRVPRYDLRWYDWVSVSCDRDRFAYDQLVRIFFLSH